MRFNFPVKRIQGQIKPADMCGKTIQRRGPAGANVWSLRRELVSITADLMIEANGARRWILRTYYIIYKKKRFTSELPIERQISERCRYSRSDLSLQAANS